MLSIQTIGQRRICSWNAKWRCLCKWLSTNSKRYRENGWNLVKHKWNTTGNPPTPRFCPNPFWYPYYPWVADCKNVLMNKPSLPLPETLADEILSYFEWREGSHKTMQEKYSNVFLKPFCNPPLGVPRSTLQNLTRTERMSRSIRQDPPAFHRVFY